MNMNKRTLFFILVAVFLAVSLATSSCAIANDEPDADDGANRKSAPTFTVATTDGGTFRLGEQRGKVVVLFFTAPGCTVCITQLPAMARLHSESDQAKVAMMAINIFPQYSEQEFLAYMAQHKGAAHYYALDKNSSITRSYGVQSTGVTVIIDNKGRIAEMVLPPGLTYDELKALIEGLI